ncbi:MAG: MFS transporter [Ornithinimicrobium sp.]
MSAVFAALSVRNYRIYAAGALVSNTGTWMGRVAQDWVVLTQLTQGSAQALGIVTGLQFLPMLLFAPLGGALSDRFAKRRVMFFAQGVMAATAVAMGVLVLLGTMTLWQMYVLAFVQGTAAAIDAPARQSFVSELVPPERVTNAVGLNSASFNGGRLIGPGLAGLLIAAVGSGPTLLLNAATFVAVMVALVMLDSARLRPSPRSQGRGQIREGIRYVRGRPDILLIMGIVFVHGTFGMNFQLTNALMATEVFNLGVKEFGLLGSLMAIGSLGGALLAAKRERPRWRMLLGSFAGFTLCTALLALAPSYALYAVLLVPTGLTALTVMVTANSMVQLSVDAAVRGRVMSLYMAVFFGGTPLGAPMIGWIGDEFGARWTIGVATLMCAMAVTAATLYLMRTDDLHVRRGPSLAHPMVLQRGPVPGSAADEPRHGIPEQAR